MKKFTFPITSQGNVNLSIKKVIVLLSQNTDRVTVYTDLPCPFIKESGLTESLDLSFETSQGKGVEYVRDNFGIEPEIIDSISFLRKG